MCVNVHRTALHCTVLLPPGGNPIAVIKYVIISQYNTLLPFAALEE
jgi:hypothetical protein